VPVPTIAAVHFGFQAGELTPERVSLQRLPDHNEQVILVERFGEKIVGALFHRVDRGLNRSTGRHDDDRHIFGLLQFGEAFRDLDAGEPGHIEVEKHEMGNFLLNLLHRLTPSRATTVL